MSPTKSNLGVNLDYIDDIHKLVQSNEDFLISKDTYSVDLSK